MPDVTTTIPTPEIRNAIADYFSFDGGTTWEFAGIPFTTLNQAPSAQVDTKAYVSDSSSSSSIRGYETSFDFEYDLMANSKIALAFYDISTREKTGGAAMVQYCRIELFRPIEDEENVFTGVQRTVSVEVSSIDGAGTETIVVSGTLHNYGQFTEISFDTTTKTPTPVV